MRKTFTIMLLALLALAARAQDEESLPSFTSGKFKYEIVDADRHWVQITYKRAPGGTSEDDHIDAGYSGLAKDDFKSEVTYDGQTYQVVGIGANAFMWCTLNENAAVLTLPEGLLYIDEGAFSYTKLESNIKLPTTLRLIAESAFTYNRLSGITVQTDNPYFAHLASDQEGRTMSVLTNKEKTKIIAVGGAKVKSWGSDGSVNYITTYTVPEQITEIGDCAFMGNSTLTRVTLHSGITRLGMGAFYESVITRVSVPNPDCEIGSSCFAHCTKLTSVNLPEGMKKLGRHVFFYCENLSTITLPEGMEEIGMMCFGSCALTTVNLPETMVKLDTCSLQDNPFTSIDLKNVKWVGRQCFSQCTNLKTITGNPGALERISGAAFTRCNAITTPYLPEGLKVLEMNAYFRNTGFTTMTIPSTVECINGNPAVGSTNCTAYLVAEGNPYFTSIDGVLYATGGNTVLPEDGDDAPVPADGPTVLVGVPAALPTTELIVPEGVTAVANQAVREVPITSLVLPSTMQVLRVSSFSSAKALTSVTCLAKNPPVGGDEFNSEVYAAATLYVPINSLDAYRQAEGWKEFATIEGIDTGEPTLPGDVNGDGVLDVDDVNTIINSILADDNLEACDVNGDGSIDVEDVNALINLILAN